MLPGQGTNAREIIRYFHEEGHLVLGQKVEISLIVCNKPGAGVLDIAETAGIPVLLIEKEKFFRGSHYLEEFKNRNISFIVLAGFLMENSFGTDPGLSGPDPEYPSGPASIITAVRACMEQRFMKPWLRPASIKAELRFIMWTNIYDHGRIFFQASFNLSPDETAETLAEKIHALEYRHYPEQIARWLECKLSLNP